MSDESKFICPICDKDCKKEGYLAQHIKFKHSEEDKKTNNKDGQNGNPVCEKGGNCEFRLLNSRVEIERQFMQDHNVTEVCIKCRELR